MLPLFRESQKTLQRHPGQHLPQKSAISASAKEDERSDRWNLSIRITRSTWKPTKAVKHWPLDQASDLAKFVFQVEAFLNDDEYK
jgi:hypothetical protein